MSYLWNNQKIFLDDFLSYFTFFVLLLLIIFVFTVKDLLGRHNFDRFRQKWCFYSARE